MSICLIPETMEQLSRDLERLTPDSLVLAGGTDLILRMREKRLQPDVLLSLSGVKELRDITITPDRAVIGAMATMAQVKRAADGLEDLQALADAAGGVGSPQIRNKGTIGGNVANASPAGDLPPVLWMLDAQAGLMAPGGCRRSLPVRQLLVDSGRTQLAPGELIVSFNIDRAALRGWRTVFEKLGHRSQVTISRIGLAVGLRQDGTGVVQEARVVAGAIKPVPFRLSDAEQLLLGKRPDPGLARAVGDTFKGNTRRAYKEAAAKGVAENALIRFQR